MSNILIDKSIKYSKYIIDFQGSTLLPSKPVINLFTAGIRLN